MPPSRRAGRLPRALFVSMLSIALSGAGCGGRLFGKVYEYEEDLHLSLDGSAEIIINASVPALVALRGLQLDVRPTAIPDRDRIRAAYESPPTGAVRVSRSWRRQGRRFVQVRVRTNDVRTLPGAKPFAWSNYELVQRDGEYVFRQSVGAAAFRPGTLQNFGWTGQEMVAFRLHLPSRITWHNARDLESNGPARIQRGNILSWEQPLADRLDGEPIAIEVRMETQSILHRTLWLFAAAFAAAVLLLAGLIWLTIRKGAKQASTAP